jgi:predicted dehydrogenase
MNHLAIPKEMRMKRRCLMLGAGGMASAWIRHFFPNFRDRMEIAGLVDIRSDVLNAQGDFLGLPANRRFTSTAEAFDKVEADFCTIVTPPSFHREAVLLATARKMDILSEKPIADTWEASVDILHAARQAGVRMQIVQNYRFTPRILTFQKALRDGRIGRLNYMAARFAQDARRRGAWGAFRHEMLHPLLIEGSIHHFDQLRNLIGANCRHIAGMEWRPEQDSFAGEPCALLVMRFENEVRAQYEGTALAAGKENSWHQEFYRAEGEEGALVLDSDHVVRVLKRSPGGLLVEDLPMERPRYEGHNAIIDQFLTWLEGGPEPPTQIEDNIRSLAMVFGAIRASETGQTVDVAAMVAGVDAV